MQLQIFYYEDGQKTVKKGRRPRTTDNTEAEPEGPRPQKTAGEGKQHQLFPALRQSSRRRRKQPDPLPPVKRR